MRKHNANPVETIRKAYVIADWVQSVIADRAAYVMSGERTARFNIGATDASTVCKRVRDICKDTLFCDVCITSRNGRYVVTVRM